MKTEEKSKHRPIDTLSPRAALKVLLAEQVKAARAAQRAAASIERAVKMMVARLKESDEGRIVYAGAGTSGRTGVQDGAELWPTFGWPDQRLLYCMAGWPLSLTRSVEGAEDEERTAVKFIESHEIGTKDVLIAVAASGTTPFTLAALREAKQWGALTIGIANNRGSPILKEAQCPIFLSTGVEPIAGSTRMKAGTAQRIALNTLSTLVMVGLGHVYKGFMVNVQAKCRKIDSRRIRIVMALTDCTKEQATSVLMQADGDVRVAVMLQKGFDMQSAKLYLNVSKGNLREALASCRIVRDT